jgi:hypothetical protein
MIRQRKFLALGLAFYSMVAVVGSAEADDRLVGIWSHNDGSQIVEYIFRSDGRYQLETRSIDPEFDFSFSEPGYYRVEGASLTVTPYEFFGSPSGRVYDSEVLGSSLSLTSTDFPLEPVVYQFQPGSREEVLARQNVDSVLIGAWQRPIPFWGTKEYTFRPGGYYFIKEIPESGDFAPEFVWGRYTQAGARLTLKPYSGIEAHFELDFFGDTVSLIDSNDFSGNATTLREVPGSQAEVLAQSAVAEAFLNATNWQVGVWVISNGVNTTELTFRPDDHYISTNSTEILRGMVRGRYLLESRRIHFFPFTG